MAAIHNVNPRHWRAARNQLVRDLDNNTPLQYAWSDMQAIVGGYQMAKGLQFMALPAFERPAMRDFLVNLK